MLLTTYFPPSVNVTHLNGVNGFVVNGMVLSALVPGWMVQGVGDINADGISDIIIGTWGPCYVVFGRTDIASFGVSDLTGANGFSINLPNYDAGAIALVSGLGDINGDHIADLMIEAPWNGECYVVFGSSQIGSSGTFNLAALDGLNGFVITGLPTGVFSSYTVSEVGDVNADGVADLLIGAPTGVSSGQAYIIFGQSEIGNFGKFKC